jgi:myo-inositol catabolism protein IolC
MERFCRFSFSYSRPGKAGDQRQGHAALWMVERHPVWLAQPVAYESGRVWTLNTRARERCAQLL